MDDGGLGAGLGPDANRTLLQWSAQLSLRHRLDRWFVDGATNAKVAVVERHCGAPPSSRKLVLKLDTVKDDDFGKTEYARHYAAVDQSPRFAKAHLAALVGTPIPVGDDHWLTFQTLAGTNVGYFDTVGSLLAEFLDEDGSPIEAEVFAAVCGNIIRGVLTEWAGPPDASRRLTVPEFMALHLGTRLAPGTRLSSLSQSLSDERMTVRDGLLDPLALLRDGPLTRGVMIAVMAGKSHGDLHVVNSLIRVRPRVDPNDYYLIDLAKYERNAPLVRDHVHFLLHMIARSLRVLDASARNALIDTLLDPESPRRSKLPTWLRLTIAEVYRAGEEWVHDCGFELEWRSQRLLSLAACSLIVRDRSTTRPGDVDWFTHLAARAGARFFSVDEPGNPAPSHSLTMRMPAATPSAGASENRREVGELAAAPSPTPLGLTWKKYLPAIALPLAALLFFWISTKIADDRTGENSPPGGPPTNGTSVIEAESPESKPPRSSNEAPSEGSCVPGVICRYLDISVGQEFNLDPWGLGRESMITLLGAEGLAAVSGDVKISPIPQPYTAPANPLPCPDAGGWTNSISQVKINEGVCVRTPGGKYFLLKRLDSIGGENYQRFLVAGFPN